ncbi:MAG TPA: mechanosensitive ion channel domain-containing protein [Caulobacteraceae bacterium]|nr:mechanosensitive ion channel domain-containing protein [Caulobacteraceae bacterium]
MPFAARLAVSAAIQAAAFVLARLASAGFRRLRSRAAAEAPSIYIVEKLAVYGLVLAGGFLALSALGVNLTSLAVFVGAIGVGVGLGLQGIVREFVSGLVLIFDPLVNVGEYVEIESGMRGEILEVGPRATRLRTADDLNVIIPNSKLVEGQVVNWTLKGGTRRLHVPFSVAYGSDKAQVREAVIAAARSVPFTLPETDRHRTQVWLVGFGDSALNFELIVWPSAEAIKRPASAKAAYTWAIEEALRQADIEIPFPQLDLRFRSLFGRENEEAARLAGLSPAKAPRRPGPLQSTNDAADDLMNASRTEDADSGLVDTSREDTETGEADPEPIRNRRTSR